MIEARGAAAAIHAQLGRLDQAKAMLLGVVADYPSVGLPYNNLGYVYYLLGDYGAAAAMLRKALALEVGNDRACNNLRLAEAAMTRPARVSPSNAASIEANVPTAAIPAAATMPRPVSSSAMELIELEPNLVELERRARPLVAAFVQLIPAASAIAPAREMSARVEIANGNGITGWRSGSNKCSAAKALR